MVYEMWFYIKECRCEVFSKNALYLDTQSATDGKLKQLKIFQNNLLIMMPEDVDFISSKFGVNQVGVDPCRPS